MFLERVGMVWEVFSGWLVVAEEPGSGHLAGYVGGHHRALAGARERSPWRQAGERVPRLYNIRYQSIKMTHV